MSTSRLFEPIRVGDLTLSHRIALAPLTRLRNSKEHVPTELMHKYYERTAKGAEGGLLITEATAIAGQASGLPHVPGIWSEEQIAAWKEIVKSVHAHGAHIFMQIWALGRSANPNALKAKGFDYVAPSPYPYEGNTPRALTVPEIKEYAQLFATAARNAVEGAGFDGVEVHGANGYLVHQFLVDQSNFRTDEYGGSIENRARFGLEVIQAISDAVGQKKTAIRLSPFSPFYGIEMKNPKPQYAYFVEQLRDRFPDLAYIHSVEPRSDPLTDAFLELDETVGTGNDFLREIWSPRPFVIAGGYTPETAKCDVDKYENDIIAFGRHYLANPDLPRRLREGLPLNKYHRPTFYIPDLAEGYVDYPFVGEKAVERAPFDPSLLGGRGYGMDTTDVSS
ncbi:putative NADPH2 dehydrogenase chain OYE2 [Dentipellis sp. KUC8613]|nr:putative NADPH2 dehydrogenase chain OYE2 [Dentipellis sp. KUC8613]